MSEDFPVTGFRRQRTLSLAALGTVAALAAGAALWLWLDVRALGEREAALEQQMQSLARHAEALATGSKHMSATLGTINAGQADLALRVDGLYGTRRAGLLASEAEYLVRLAAQRLALMQDPAGALALLSAADGVLADIRDADTHAARAALSRDISALRSSGTLDVEALYLRLSALPAQLESAGPVAASGTAAGTPAATATPSTAPPVSAWDRLVGTVTSLVTIRRVDVAPAPAVTPGEREMAARTFALLVQQAQLALLQRNGAIYQHSLAQADQWLDRTSTGHSQRRQALRRELSSLRAIDIGARLPDLSASMGATRTLAARLLPDGVSKDASP